MKIRTARLIDLKECERISKVPELRLATKEYPNRKYLKEFLSNLFIIIEDNGKIIGYLVGEKEKVGIVCLNVLVVNKKYRRKGIGKLLIDEFRKRCKKMKLKEIYFLAPNWNKKTTKFYEKYGFTRMRYYSYFTGKV